MWALSGGFATASRMRQSVPVALLVKSVYWGPEIRGRNRISGALGETSDFPAQAY